MFDLVTAGEAFDDLVFFDLAALPKRGQELKSGAFTRSPGGGAVITTLAAARLGLHCAIVSGLSGDAAQMLRDAGISVTNLRRRGEPAAISVALATRRDRSSVRFNGMNDRLPARLLAMAPRLRGKHVHFAFGPRPCRPWIRVVDDLRRRGITTSWDFGWNPDLAQDPYFRKLATSVDYLFLNREEALLYVRQGELSRAIARWRRSPRTVVIKMGAAGSRLVGGLVNVQATPMRGRATDTTASGDGFNAGFLAARLRGADLVTALTLANRVGAMSTLQPGGTKALTAIKRVMRRSRQRSDA